MRTLDRPAPRTRTMRPLVVLLMVVGGLVAPAAADDPPVLLLSWGQLGAANGQFFDPQGIATSALGSVYVADTGNNRIQRFLPDSTFLGKWGALGSEPGEFNNPWDLTCDPWGNVYVSDFNDWIQKFDANGAWLASRPGIGHLAADPDGEVVYLSLGASVQKLRVDLTLVEQWTLGHPGLSQFGGIGTAPDGDLYIPDEAFHQVLRVSSSGTLIAVWGDVRGEGDYQFDAPKDVAVDGLGNVYVLDVRWIRKFTREGTLLARWGGYGSGPGLFPGARGIAVDDEGNVYVADRGNHRIQKFNDSVTPTVRTTWGHLKARYRPGK